MYQYRGPKYKTTRQGLRALAWIAFYTLCIWTVAAITFFLVGRHRGVF